MAKEDLTTYTKEDPNNKLTVTSSKVTWTSLGDNQTAYLYKDIGVDYFDADFEHRMTVRINSSGTTTNTLKAGWALANAINDLYQLQVAEETFLALRCLTAGDGTPWLGLLEHVGTTTYVGGAGIVSYDTTYYLTIKRDESEGDYGKLYLYVYTDSARTNLLNSGSLALHTKTDFRYIYAVNSRNDGGASTQSGYLEDIDLGVASPTVTTEPATGLAPALATLNGTLDDDGGEACDCGFEWGETDAYGNTTPTQSRTTGQTFAQQITGLEPGETYHFRAFATNSAGTGYGADRIFTTSIILSKAYALGRWEL